MRSPFFPKYSASKEHDNDLPPKAHWFLVPFRPKLSAGISAEYFCSDTRRIFRISVVFSIVYMLQNTDSIKNLYIPIRYLETWLPKDFKHASQRTLCIERSDIYRHFIGLFTPASDSIQQRRINIYHGETRGTTISRGTCRSHRKPL